MNADNLIFHRCNVKAFFEYCQNRQTDAHVFSEARQMATAARKLIQEGVTP